MTYDQVDEQIKLLESLNLADVTFAEVKDMVLPLFKCGFKTVTFPKGKYIFRGVTFDQNESINYLSRISYPPVEYLPEFNRASSNPRQIFYGSVGRFVKDTQIGNIISNFEISNIHKPSFTNTFEYMALGRWYAKQDFTVVVLGLDSNISKNNTDAVAFEEFMENFRQDKPSVFKIVQKASQFVSTQFSKVVNHNFNYKITAAYCDIIFESGFHAIMYPSVKGKGYTFNIALSRELVDEILLCDFSGITRSRMIANQVFGEYSLISEKIMDDGRFVWKDPPLGARISNFELKMIEKEIRAKGSFDSGNWIIK